MSPSIHRRFFHFAVLLCAASYSLCGLPAHALEQIQGAVPLTLKNPGFEGGFIDLPPPGSKKGRILGSIARGWSDNSDWANVEATYSPDLDNPHSGKSSQKISVARVSGGAVQFVQTYDFNPGVYVYRVWMRGTPGTTIDLTMRRPGAPYTVYGASTATLSAEWKEFSVSGSFPEKVTAALMLISNGPTTFWVDDAACDDLTAAGSAAAVRAGNLISGGSFEAGVSFGWSIRVSGPMRHAFEDVRPSIDGSCATNGKSSLRIDIPEGSRAEIRSPLVHYNFNRLHTISLDLKASAPGTPVTIRLDGAGIDTTVSVGTEWNRYVVTGTLPYCPYTRLRLSSDIKEGAAPRTLWVDSVQLEEASKASAYKAPFPHEMTLRLARPGGVIFDGEKEGLQFNFAPEAPKGARLRLSAIDLYGKNFHLPDVKFPIKTLPLPDFEKGRRGMVKLHAEAVDSKGNLLAAPVDLIWARLPKPREIEPDKSFFGVHIPLSKDYIALARASGQRWTRLHDASMIAKWAIAEPKPGEWAFFDDAVSAAHDGGMAVLGMLDGAPPWATDKPRAKEGYWSVWNIPDGNDKWENYVHTVTDHYKGRIDYWEVWNEPWGRWWTGAGGTPARYAELLKVAYKTAKEANPAAKIIGIDTYRGNDWTDHALAAAGTDCFDGFSFHDYSNALHGGPDNQAMQDVRQYTEAQAKYGQPRPLWITEGGPGMMGSFYAPETGGVGPREQLAEAVRYDVTEKAAGVRAFFLYALPDDPAMGEPDYCAVEFDRTIKPILAGRAVLASLIDGAQSLGRTEPTPGVDAFAFQQTDGQKVTVVWSYDGLPHEVKIPKNAKVLDAQGNPLPAAGLKSGIEPVYLVEGGKG